MKFLLTFPLLLALLLPLQACATKYSAEPIQAMVMDVDTNEPIADVVVVAHWQLEGGLGGYSNVGQMMVMEAVTGKDGKFSFPAWGPKEVPGGLSVWHQNARLKNMDPELLFFKSGYEDLTLRNGKTLGELSGDGPYVRTSKWNGQTIKMKKFLGSLKQYAEHLDRGGYGVMRLLDKATTTEYCSNPSEGTGCAGRGACEWKNIPKMIVAIGKQAKIFEAANIYRGTYYDGLKSSEESMLKRGCGSVKAFLSEHEK